VRGESLHHRDVRTDEHEQERLYALVPGPDGHLYIPSVPTKGQLGGALTRLDPSTLEYAVYRGIIPNQSVTSVAAAPETGEIFGTSDVRGGTSASIAAIRAAP
jgi:hypothetical protein